MDERPSGPMPEMEAVEPPVRRRGIWAGIRHVLARYFRFALRNRWVGCFPILIGLLLICGLAARNLPQFARADEPLAELEMLPVNEIGTVIDERDDAVVAYIEAMIAFDADRMWSAYNESVKGDLASRGSDLEQLRRGLAQARQRGAKIESVTRLGSYPLRDGRRYVFYVVHRSGFPPTGSAEEIFFVFTVDPVGKILSIT